MMVQSFGDMSQYLLLRTRSVDLNDTLSTLTQELSTGVASDLPAQLGGDLGFVVDLERSISNMDSYQVTAQETALFATTAQTYLTRISDNMGALSSDILGTSVGTSDATTQSLAGQARNHLESTISNLNGQLSGRSLFAGIDTSSVALEGADTMMTALEAEVAGLTDPDDIVTAVENWFDDPAGFDTIMYNGSSSDMAPVRIGATTDVSIGVRADDERLKDVMKGLAVAALADEDSMGLSETEAANLMDRAGLELVNAQSSLIDLQADLGFVEQRIEEAQTLNAAALTSMSVTLNDLILADPAETATRIEEVEFQLQALYTVTARLSDLNLLNYV